ncbi:thiamine pyrophosphate-binding protein [Paenibacillus radicis (ex Xue et al. 2023)]|uniref:Thiamine pyrophosphate-binding protein n=1 Tax=Paenibacillus radicis (ex Xue et al. 2023) TaxID=2972489 RepID=A0ABT1YA23_9BACL|nr:thiamine pyrophosphate-binding protein [Paenibacillus radicis (ex Xue et al. 2023)]MCR8629742.1 thiamine pyrophosphate-binding protein [Paenibacillus radicis (ex Xue et al. 2023)]
MKAVRNVIDFLVEGGVKYVFGIPAGSINAFFDELYEMPQITPVVAKHEGAASYMAAAYAKHSDSLGVCIGCSGPGSTNLLTGAAHAYREHLPVLFLTGSVPVRTVGLNASQELNAVPLFQPVTKYSVSVSRAEDLLYEVARAVEIALSGIPGPVHVQMPIDIQLEQVEPVALPPFPQQQISVPNRSLLRQAAKELLERSKGIIFVGQGARRAMPDVLQLAETLNWPIVTTPQAKGFVPHSHPLYHGIFGFAGQARATKLIEDQEYRAILIVGSSLGETATSNWNRHLTGDRYTVQIDIDETVFHRTYPIDLPIRGDAGLGLRFLIQELERMGLRRNSFEPDVTASIPQPSTAYNTQNVLLSLQKHMPPSTRYAVDIGEFMSYVIHYMQVMETDTFDINVHFGAMGTAIGAAIGMNLADPYRPAVCITGDGCFFMHGMEILTAKEYNLPILFVVINNARLGMVYHGHTLQYKRSHPRFEQQPVSISDMAYSMGIPSWRVEKLQDLSAGVLHDILVDGPAVLEISIVDNNIPPMGDRVKFLSSFQK